MRLQPDGPQTEHTSATDDANNACVLMLTGVPLAVVWANALAAAGALPAAETLWAKP